jgi:hypothetical protein
LQTVLALECGLAQRETGELWAKRRELFVVGVLFGEGLQIFGEVVYGVNGIVVTRGNTCAAVGALVGINKELGTSANCASSFLGWMQSMGQASMQFSSLVQVSVITKAIWECPPRLWRSNRRAKHFRREVAESAGISELLKAKNANRTHLGCVRSRRIMRASQHYVRRENSVYAVAGLG